MARQPKGYSRVDSEDVHGWLVRIKRGDVRKSRFMSDSTYGGKRKSRDAAQQQYEEWTKEMPEPATSHDKLSVRNTTGVVGVHFACDTDSRFPNCQYESYIASWLADDGKRTKLGFSCSRYGEDAFDLACIAREKRLTDRAKVMALLERRKKTGVKSTAAPKVAKTAKKKVAKEATVTKTSAKKTSPKKTSPKKTSAKKASVKKTATKQSAGKQLTAKTSKTKKTARKK